MLIGIHSVAAFKEKRTGVEEYAFQLIKNLAEIQRASGQGAAFFVLYADKISPELTAVLNGCRNFKIKTMRFPFLWTQIRLSLEMLLNPPDILFIPAHVLPLIHPKNSVVMVHGLEYERFPEYYPFFFRLYLRWATKFSCRAAARIIVPSQSSKNDLIEIYGINSEKISVIYHGFEVFSAQENRQKFQTPEDFFLYLGRIEFKKNISGIVRAFEIFKEKRASAFKLVLAGGGGFGAEELKRQIKKSKFASDIILRGYVSQEEKSVLLKNAAGFLFPSFYEGFGLPILEAQAAGVPVITSDVSSMPEAAGLPRYGGGERGALFVNPENIEEIAEKMYKITDDVNLRKTLIGGGFENIKRFSWEKCAKETLKILLK